MVLDIAILTDTPSIILPALNLLIFFGWYYLYTIKCNIKYIICGKLTSMD